MRQRLLALLVLATPLRVNAQTPADSARADSEPPRPLGCHHCIAIALAAAWAITAAAPSAWLLARDTAWLKTQPVGFARDHIAVFVVGGGSWEEPGKGWVHGETVEIVKGRLFGELRIENFVFSDLGHARFQTLRAGYLLHPWPRATGGLTLGYRRARGDRVQNAVEVGFPLIAGSEIGWLRLEPTYVISNEGVTWNYRVQGEVPIPGTPLLAGMNVEAKTIRQDGAYFWTPALVVGMRF